MYLKLRVGTYVGTLWKVDVVLASIKTFQLEKFVNTQWNTFFFNKIKLQYLSFLSYLSHHTTITATSTQCYSTLTVSTRAQKPQTDQAITAFSDHESKHYYYSVIYSVIVISYYVCCLSVLIRCLNVREFEHEVKMNVNTRRH